MDDVRFLFGGWLPIARILLVGTFAYLALVVLLRISNRRVLTRLSAFDVIVAVGIGSAFGRILTARDVALAEAVSAFALLIVLQHALAWLKNRSRLAERLVVPPPILLYYQGRLLHEAMRQEQITERELQQTAREHGIGSLADVAAIVLEADGGFSVIKTGAAGDESTVTDARRR